MAARCSRHMRKSRRSPGLLGHARPAQTRAAQCRQQRCMQARAHASRARRGGARTHRLHAPDARLVHVAHVQEHGRRAAGARGRQQRMEGLRSRMRRGRGRQRARLGRRASQAHHFLRPRPISPTLHLPCHLRTTRWRCGPAYSYLLPAGVRRVQAEPCPSHQGRRRRAWSCQRCEWKSPSLTQQQWVQPQHAGRQAGLSQS